LRVQQSLTELPARRFPSPWSVEEGETYFVVKDNDGQQLAYVHFNDPRSAAKPLTRDEARRIASNIAKLPELLGRKDTGSNRAELRELSPIASLCARSHAVLGPRKCLVETDPPRPTRLRRSKPRVRCNRESPWRWPMQTGCPVHKF
jgi:hypothetical protein